jgi:hypothetical protein
MNKLSINKFRIPLVWVTSSAFIICGVALAISGLMAQTPTPAPTPTEEFKKKAIAAFTAALTRSAKPGEDAFRAKLKDIASAKQAVEEEGKIQFPPDWIVLFYEEDQSSSPTTKSEEKMVVPNHPNHSYHIFYLPKANSGGDQLYKAHLMCCYDPWRPKVN